MQIIPTILTLRTYLAKGSIDLLSHLITWHVSFQRTLQAHVCEAIRQFPNLPRKQNCLDAAI